MVKSNNIVNTIENQVILSDEVLNYLNSLINDETKEWVEKYKDVLLDSSNIDSLKFNIHHIKPCWLFKDETSDTRRKQEILANAMNGNRIKLSIKNHIKAHYYLFRIYNDRSSKSSLCCLCRYLVKLTNLTEEEINEIAEMIEFYKSTNQTEEERQKYFELHREDARIRAKNWTKNNKEKSQIYHKNYRKINKETCRKRNKIYRENNKDRFKIKDDRPCFDPRYNKIFPKNGYKYKKFARWINLFNWARHNKNHELRKNLTNVEFANKYLLNEEQIKKFQLEIKNSIISNKIDTSKNECIDPRCGMKSKRGVYGKYTTFKSLQSWANDHKEHPLVNGMLPTPWAKQFLINKPQPKIKIEIKKEIKISESLENINKPCEDPRCGMTIDKRLYTRKYVSYQALIDWAKTHKNHPLVNGMKATDWAKQFLINKPKVRVSKSKNIKMCKDPRYGMKIGNKLYDIEIIPYETLYSWAKGNKTHPLLKGMKVVEWVNQFLIKQEKPIKVLKRQSLCKDPRKENTYTNYSSLRMWAYHNPHHPLVNNINCTKWATQFILTPQELKEYHKTHSNN